MARIEVSGQRVRMRLVRGECEVEVGLLGELRLDHAGCGAFLRAAMPARLLDLGCAIYGPAMSLTQASRVASRLQDLPFTAGQSGLPLLDLGLRPSCGLSLPLGRSFFDRLKARLRLAGLSNQGWRFLVRQNEPALRGLLELFRPCASQLREFALFINLLAGALQVLPLRADRCQIALLGAQRILERGAARASAHRLENARIYLRAVMRAELQESRQANLAHESQQVCEFMRAQPLPIAGRNLSWQALCRRAHAWHKAALMRIEPERDVRWNPLLPVFEDGAFLANELNTGARLAEEGLMQKHCVGSYANACASGSCRIFSLRCNGRRIATIELRRDQHGAWLLGQVHGKANTTVRDAAVLDVARQVAAAYARAAGPGT
jgi:hypothetical protein